MPLPKPNHSEDEAAWMSRCAADPAMTADYPDRESRCQVCRVLWRRAQAVSPDRVEPDEGITPAREGPTDGGGGLVGAVGGRPPSEFRIVPFGVVLTDDPASGHSFTFTRAQAAQAVAWFTAAGRRLAIDFEHQTIKALNTRADQLAPAAGWIGGLEIRADGLWATRVEWTAQGAALLAAGEYAYFSPVIQWADVDWTTVKRLGPVALTNDPSIRNIAPLVAATRVAAARLYTPKGGPPMDQLMKALGLQPGASEADALTAVQDLKDATTKETVAALASAMKLGEQESGDTLVAAILARVQVGTDQQAKLAELETTVAGLRESNQRTAFDALVASAEQAGKVPPAAADKFYTLFKADRSTFDAVLAAMPAKIAAISRFAHDRLQTGPTANRDVLIATARQTFVAEKENGKQVLCSERAWVNTNLRDQELARLTDDEVTKLGIRVD